MRGAECGSSCDCGCACVGGCANSSDDGGNIDTRASEGDDTDGIDGWLGVGVWEIETWVTEWLDGGGSAGGWGWVRVHSGSKGSLGVQGSN